MSYKALYRKYRPQTFEEVQGQEPIVSTLRNIISSNKISHAYLFAGPRGTGKTSVAHIFANEINRTASGSYSKNNMDIIEIDAASNNGVSEIRNIIDSANYAPASSKYKVYIIDEVHMLTKGAFNALLKTLEEPPEHLVFILATTEPHKLPVTILSRAQRFNFRRIEDQVIINQLIDIFEKEKITYENEALKFIAKLARGGMRDALSIADQSASYGNGDISFVGISQVFGVISISNITKILELMNKGNTKSLLALVNEFFDNGADLERITSSLIDVIKDFVVYKKTSSKELLVLATEQDMQAITISLDFAYEALSEFVKLLTDLKFSQSPKQLFEISLLKLSKSSGVKTSEAPQKTQEDKTVEPTQELKSSGKEVIKEVENKPMPSEPSIDDVLERVQESEQAILETQEIDNSILSTQELMLDKEVEESKPTEEIDLVSYFDSADDKEEVGKESKHTYDTDAIINMLIQAKKEKGNIYKQKLEGISSYIEEVSNKDYIDLLKQTKFISGGKDFMILSSANDDIVDKIQNINHDNEFLQFVNIVFERPLLVVAITKNNFELVKEKWKELSTNNLLPSPTPIEKLELEQEEKTEEEKYGEDIFGDLFQ